MELIPILSTIILVATISTFLLSIGAYILYKIRERKFIPGRKTSIAPVQAELVVPADVIPSQTTVHGLRSSEYQSPFTVQKPAAPIIPQKKHTSVEEPKRFSVEKELAVPERKQYARKRTDTKFFKYTSEGYVPTEEDKMAGTFRWR